MRAAIVAGIMLPLLGASNVLAQMKLPYEIVRSVQALHDQMALGSKAAQAAMPGLLRKLADRLVAAPPAAWRDHRNSGAIVVYLLSGGEIRVAEKVLESRQCAPMEKRLIEGALAYLEGDKAAAKSLLGSVDVRTLEPAVGSHIALAQAALVAQDNPARAIGILDMARVLAPGTLVEDAALRREVFLAEQATNFDKFVAMADEYLRRFRRSVYAPRFRRSLWAAILRMALSGEVGQRQQLVRLISEMSPHEQLHLYLEIGQTATMDGKFAAAGWAADKAAVLAAKDSIEAHRAMLYDGTASVLTTDYDRGLAELHSVGKKHLPHSDAVLAKAAIDLAQDIRTWPQVPSSPVAAAGNAAKTQDAASAQRQVDATDGLPAALAATMKSNETTIAEAQQVLTESGALLEGMQ